VTATIVVEVALEDLPPAHAATTAARAELEGNSTGLAGVTPATFSQSIPGTKGSLTELAYVVASPSGAAALVAAWRLWLNRDRRRTLKVRMDDESGSSMLEVTGEAVSLSALQRAIDSALRRPTAPEGEDSGDHSNSS